MHLPDGSQKEILKNCLKHLQKTYKTSLFLISNIKMCELQYLLTQFYQITLLENPTIAYQESIVHEISSVN